LTRRIEPAKTDSAFRLVGYLEYGMALAQFDRLLNAISPEELQIVEEIVRSREEFVVYTNVSRPLETEASTLSEVGGRPGDDFRRHGLAWLVALARVELGAMAAGFTDQEDPFALVRPGQFELAAYIELLADGMRSHYWALRADRVARNPRGAGLTDSQAIAYVRRVHLATSFLRAFRDRARASLTPAQLTELRRWERGLEQLNQTLLFDVLKLGTQLVASVDSTKVKSKRLLGGQNASDETLSQLPSCVRNAARDLEGGGDPQPAGSDDFQKKR